MRHLLGVGLCQRHRRPLRLDLLAERRQLRAGHVVRGGGAFQLLLGADAFLQHPLGAVQRNAGVAQLGLRRGLLRLGGRDSGLRLTDLVGCQPLLAAQGGLAFGHL